MDDLNSADWLAAVLVIVGALNWGLFGLGGLLQNDQAAFNLVRLLLGSVPVAENVVYVLVGLAGLYGAYMMYDKTQ